MISLRKMSLALVVVAAMLLSIVPVGAQDEELPVLILPIDGAQFLPGARFDFSVEVHADVMPDNFSVTINGEPAADTYGEGEATSWEFGSEDAPIPSQAVFWRGLEAPAPGEYVVEVTAGATTATATWTVREPSSQGAQNVILFIADGGTVATYTAARLVSRGMEDGSYLGNLSFEEFEEIGLLHTSGIDSIITDSANSASAYNTGHKTAVNATGVYPNTSDTPFDDPYVETFAEMITRLRGMSVGIVTDAEFVDATPAAVWAHSRARTNETRADYAGQIIGLGALETRADWDGIFPNVIFGGAGRYMIPQTVDGSARGDDLDMYTLYEEAGYTVVTTGTEMTDAGSDLEHIVGTFHPGNMSVWLDRNVYTNNLGDFTDQPGLVDMTVAALEILDNNENGFYLQVEGASIDKQLHPMDFERAIANTIEFDQAIAATMEYLEANGLLENTLVVVTSDHGHSFDVYGTVDVEAFNAGTNDVERRSAIGVYADAGFPTYEDADGDFYPDSWDVDIALAWGKVDHPEFTEDYQVSTVPRVPAVRNEDNIDVDNPADDPNGIFNNSNLPAGSTTSVHTLQDVPIYATGPGSEYFGQVMENYEVFFGMAEAIGLDPGAEDGMATVIVEEASPSNPVVQAGFNATAILLLIVGIGFGAFIGATTGRRRDA